MIEELYPWNLLHAVGSKDVDKIKENFSDDHRAGLKYAISTLGEKDREFVRLRYMEGKSDEDIEQAMSCIKENLLIMEKRVLQRLGEAEQYNFIRYGISGYIQKILTEEYQKGFESGYQNGYEDGVADAKNGFSRTERDISIMSLPLEVLQLDSRSFNCLFHFGCRTVGDCIRMDDLQIRRIRNLGKKSADAIARALRRKNIKNTDWDNFIIRGN